MEGQQLWRRRVFIAILRWRAVNQCIIAISVNCTADACLLLLIEVPVKSVLGEDKPGFASVFGHCLVVVAGNDATIVPADSIPPQRSSSRPARSLEPKNSHWFGHRLPGHRYDFSCLTDLQIRPFIEIFASAPEDRPAPVVNQPDRW